MSRACSPPQRLTLRRAGGRWRADTECLLPKLHPHQRVMLNPYIGTTVPTVPDLPTQPNALAVRSRDSFAAAPASLPTFFPLTKSKSFGIETVTLLHAGRLDATLNTERVLGRSRQRLRHPVRPRRRPLQQHLQGRLRSWDPGGADSQEAGRVFRVGKGGAEGHRLLSREATVQLDLNCNTPVVQKQQLS